MRWRTVTRRVCVLIGNKSAFALATREAWR
jgi:hypothetical protein